MVRIEIPPQDSRPEIVHDALAGRIERLPPSLALAMLPDLVVDESEHRRILHEILEDRGLETRVRAMAVNSLASLEVESAVAELLGVLDQPDLEEEVASRAAAMLGRIAGPEQLDRLEDVRMSAATDVLRERAVFAQALIVHRFGLPEPRIDLPPAESQHTPESIGALAFVSRKLGLPRSKHVIEGVRHKFPHIDLRKHDVYELQCGRRPMAVVVQKELVTPKGMREISEGPALAAVMAFSNEETGDFFPALVALTSPTDQDRISVLVARLMGEPVFLGTGFVESERVEIELTSAKTPGVPAIAARVRMWDNTLEITGISERRTVSGRTLERSEPPMQ